MRLQPPVLRQSIRMLVGLSMLAAILPPAAQANPPHPPPRPARKTAPPANPPPTSPPPANPAPPVVRPVVPSDDADLDPDRPPVLPAAPRSKMHECGREWQEMKRRGADRNQTWRQFATACLQKN